MKIINCRQDIDTLPESEKADWLIRLAATIYQQNAEGAIITNTATIERFGYTLEDFPDAPIAPFIERVPTPEEAAAAQRQAAYNAAADVFESLPLGKQALWEPVRAAVGAAIMEGDTPKAYEIITTLPVIYPGAEDDRALFLALFV